MSFMSIDCADTKGQVTRENYYKCLFLKSEVLEKACWDDTAKQIRGISPSKDGEQTSYALFPEIFP